MIKLLNTFLAVIAVEGSMWFNQKAIEAEVLKINAAVVPYFQKLIKVTGWLHIARIHAIGSKEGNDRPEHGNYCDYVQDLKWIDHDVIGL